MSRYFVVCPLGFEDELEKEIREFWPFLIAPDGRNHSDTLQVIKKIPGGIEIENSDISALQIQFFSKLASRVLRRLATFEVREFSLLERRLRELNLDRWLLSQSFRVHISAQKSKLGHEKRIFETAQRIWGARVQLSTKSSGQVDGDFDVFLRLDADQCTVSLDSSGQHLHLRGTKPLQGKAPLRSTIAARLIRELIAETPCYQLRDISFVDPMAGSGTIALEAWSWGQPHFQRSYAFQRQGICPKILKSPSLRANYLLPKQPLWKNIFAFDQDPSAVEMMKANAHGCDIQIEQRDLFAGESFLASDDLQNSGSRTWLLTNPPYGDRISANFTWKDWVAQIEKVYRPERWGFLIPRDQAQLLPRKTPKGHDLEKRLQLKNGGISVCYFQVST